MRKVYVNVTIKLIINVDEDIEIQEVLDNMFCKFEDTTTKAEIEDSEIIDYEIEDSK